MRIFQNLFLKHHYRSEHPALIEFSNRHFYTNSLIAYPSVNSTNYPIQLHYCENGIFDERENEQEAKMIAKLLEEKLKLNQSIGVVAFSETQLNCIYRQLSPSIQLKMAERIDEGTHNFVGSAENLKMLAEGKHPSQRKITCSCGKTVSTSMYKRWHGDNCKQK